MRFRGSDPAGVEDYWTIINNFGQIRPIPEKAKNYLIWSNYQRGCTKFFQSGVYLILCGGHKRVISLGADQAYHEKHLTKVRFDRKGEVAYTRQFKKKYYDGRLRDEIVDQLKTNDQTFTSNMQHIEAKKIADTLKF